MPEALTLIIQLAERDGVTPIGDRCWDRRIDDQWRIIVNGRNETAEHDGYKVPPYSVLVLWADGWPAGIIDPFGGVIAAGAAANEDALCDALRKAIAAADGAAGSGSDRMAASAR